MPFKPISKAELDVLNDAILVLAKRGHAEASEQVEKIWDLELALQDPVAA